MGLLNILNGFNIANPFPMYTELEKKFQFLIRKIALCEISYFTIFPNIFRAS